MTPPTDAFRAKLRQLLARSGGSMRGLSAAFGRDPGYVASLLDPGRPARARPTPADLLRASDALGVPFVELLEALWEIPVQRIAAELAQGGSQGIRSSSKAQLSEADRASLTDYAAYLEARAEQRRGTGRATSGKAPATRSHEKRNRGRPRIPPR